MSVSIDGSGSITGISSLSNPSEIIVGTGASIIAPATNELSIETNGLERIRVGAAGSVTFRSSGGAFIEGYNAEDNQLDVVKLSRMGYSSTYKNLVIGKHLPNSTSYTFQSLSLNYDPNTNSSSQFNGYGGEIYVPNNNQDAAYHTRIKQPNTANDNFNDLIVFGPNAEVSRPNNPAFFARALSNTVTSGYVVSLPAALVFATESYDINADYNNTNGRFVAPISGTYFFVSSILVDNDTPTNTTTRVEMRKNGSFAGPVAYYNSSGVSGQYVQITCAGAISLSANDYVEVWGTNGYIHSGSETHFTGFLI